MKPDRDDMKEGRAKTDASLGVERAAADVDIARAVAKAESQLDSLIAQDRVLADQAMIRIRQATDNFLANKRSDSSKLSSGVIEERVTADDSKEAERSITDAVVEHERQRADEHVETRREEDAPAHARHKVQRKNTNERLLTERGEADAVAALRDANETALETALNAEIDRAEVFAMVTHDLRGPLSVILGNAGLIAEDAAAGSLAQGAADDITRAAARMGRLLTDLLDIARIDAGTFQLNKQPHSVSALLSEISRSYRPLFDDGGVTLSVDMPPEDVSASFDHDRVVQMLSNLLGNAIKFTPGGGNVHLQIEHDADKLVLVIQDNGAGIEPSALPHLFERFWQRDPKSRLGLGLGLYLCRTIARAHGGDVSVQSEVGAGSTFRIWVPMS